MSSATAVGLDVAALADASAALNDGGDALAGRGADKRSSRAIARRFGVRGLRLEISSYGASLLSPTLALRSMREGPRGRCWW
jgi:hypothetical protein